MAKFVLLRLRVLQHGKRKKMTLASSGLRAKKRKKIGAFSTSSNASRPKRAAVKNIGIDIDIAVILG